MDYCTKIYACARVYIYTLYIPRHYIFRILRHIFALFEARIYICISPLYLCLFLPLIFVLHFGTKNDSQKQPFLATIFPGGVNVQGGGPGNPGRGTVVASFRNFFLKKMVKFLFTYFCEIQKNFFSLRKDRQVNPGIRVISVISVVWSKHTSFQVLPSFISIFFCNFFSG